MESRKGEASGSPLATVVMMAVVAAIASFATYRFVMRDIESRLAAHAPVAVVDVRAIAVGWTEGSSPDERIQNGLAKAHQIAKELAARGYLVVDRDAVLEAPPALVVGAQR